MVEEHSTNLTCRIDPDYPTAIPAPVLSPSCQTSDLKDQRSEAALVESRQLPLVPAEEPAPREIDLKTVVDGKKDTFKTSR